MVAKSVYRFVAGVLYVAGESDVAAGHGYHVGREGGVDGDPVPRHCLTFHPAGTP